MNVSAHVHVRDLSLVCVRVRSLRCECLWCGYPIDLLRFPSQIPQKHLFRPRYMTEVCETESCHRLALFPLKNVTNVFGGLTDSKITKGVLRTIYSLCESGEVAGDEN